MSSEPPQLENETSRQGRDEVLLLESIKRSQWRALKALSRSALVVREIISLGDELKRDPASVKRILKFGAEQVTSEIIEVKSQATLDLIDDISRVYKKTRQLRTKLDSTPRSKKPQFRRTAWNLGRARVRLSQLIRSFEFANSERRRFVAVMKSAVDRISEFDRELGKLERKADHTKKKYRKAIQKEIRAVKTKIVEIEESTRSTARELKVILRKVLAADNQVATEIQALDELRITAARLRDSMTDRPAASLGRETEGEKPAIVIALPANGVSVETLLQRPNESKEVDPQYKAASEELSVEDVVTLEVEEAPTIELPENGLSSRRPRGYRARRVDFEFVDDLNRRLGKRGEDLVVQYERQRLIDANRPDLAERVLCISEVHGDGAGFDVLSFTDDGNKMYIEVKATTLGKHSPFLVSVNELDFSDEHSDQFYLYRVFNLAQSPRLFILRGSLKNRRLEPIQFRVFL